MWNFRTVETRLESVPVSTEQGPPYHVSLLCLLRLCPVGSIQTSGIEKERPVHCCFSSNKQRRSVGSDRLGRRVRNRDRRRQQHTNTFEGLRATPQNERHKSNRRSDNSRTTVVRIGHAHIFLCGVAVFSRQSWLSALRPIERRRKICCFGGSGMHACDRSSI